MIITRLFLLITIVHCCTTYGSDLSIYHKEKLRNTSPSQPSLLFIALQRAVEQKGFGTILNKVKNNEYKRVIMTGISMYAIPYAFLWTEWINRSDTSSTAQLLSYRLREEGEWYGTTKVIVEENTAFYSTGLFQTQIHDHRKDDILAMLEQLRPPQS